MKGFCLKRAVDRCTHKSFYIRLRIMTRVEIKLPRITAMKMLSELSSDNTCEIYFDENTKISSPPK